MRKRARPLSYDLRLDFAAINMLGPISNRWSGFQYILVIADQITKLVLVVLLYQSAWWMLFNHFETLGLTVWTANDTTFIQERIVYI